MNQQLSEFVQAWIDGVARHDMASLAALFADDAIFRSPAVFRPYQGRQTVMQILSLVDQVFQDLKYDHVFSNDQGGVVLQFRTTVLGSEKELEIQGVDIFQLGADGLIQEMTVMIRPLRGLQGLATAMEKRMGIGSS